MPIRPDRRARSSPSTRARLTPALSTAAVLAAAGCLSQPEAPERDHLPVRAVASELTGANLSGMNLGGMNLGGMNLGGMNLGGPNMGGSNLGGMNLAGANLSGTNMGGNNLGGMNLASTNLGGMNLGGMNLGGMNLGGMNLGASNLSGSNLAGTNLGGMNLGGMNLGGMNLAGANTGYNLHGLPAADGMLWSGEDVWTPKTSQRIVLGLGSTAFPKLLSQQSSNATISVALGKLPWGFPRVAGGPVELEAWEAFVWGDRSYASFLLVAPPGSSWSGVAGFIKAVFRWNAPPSQTMEISGTEASAKVDPTLSTQVLSYTGMMDAGRRLMAGTVSEADFVAGLLAFVTATTNNQTVRVDFSAWLRDIHQNGQVLANVESADPPPYAEGVYHVSANGDGTAAVSLSRVDVANGSGLISSHADLATSYTAYRQGLAPRPLPSRCSGALYLSLTYGEPIPLGKCDAGLSFTESPAGYPVGHKAWSTVHGTTAPMNQLMYLPYGAGSSVPYQRAPGQDLQSETYIFMWEPNHVLPAAAIGGATGADRTSLGVAVSSRAPCSVNDGPGNAFDNLGPGKWCATGGAPSAAAPASLMYMWGAAIPITSYRITSAPDLPGRDPKSWTFQGCDGSCTAGADGGWVTLDTRSNQAFATRLQSLTYSFGNGAAYAQYRLRITASASNDDAVQLRELQLFDSGGAVAPLAGVDRTENGTVTWTGRACSPAELPTRAFDNLMGSAGATRWCVAGVPSAARPVSLAYGWAVAPPAVTSYRITSASDAAARDPRSWTLQGCNGTCSVGEDGGWVTLHTRSGETFTARHQTRTYNVSNTVAYRQYRLRVTASAGDTTAFQLGELQLY